jgi:hypothetical protein
MKKIILSLLVSILIFGCKQEVKYPSSVDLATESEFLNTFNVSTSVNYNEYKVIDQDSTTIVLLNNEKNISIYLTKADSQFLAKIIDNTNGNVYKFKQGARGKLYQIYNELCNTKERYILTLFNEKLKSNK